MGTPERDAEDRKFRDVISRSISASLLSNIFYLTTRLFIPPFILHYVTLGEYGLWSYCFILIGYLGMSAFGITNVYMRYVAVYAAQNRPDLINRLISTGVITISAICLAALPFLWFGLPWLFDIFHIHPEYYRTAFILIFGTMIIFMCDLTIGVYCYVLQSLQKIVAEKIIWTISYTVETLLIILLLLTGFGIYSLLWAFAVRTFLSTALYMYACKRTMPELRFSYRLFDREMLKLFFHFGGIVQLSGLLGIANRSIEKVLAGVAIGVEATGLYEVGEKFPIMSLMLPGSINTVFLPATAHLHAKERPDEIVNIYTKGSRFINILTASMMGFMAAFATPMITAWLGPDKRFDMAAQILWWFTFAYQMDVLTGPASAIYRSINRPGKELLYGILRFVFSLGFACIGFAFYGATIPVINVTVATMMILTSLIYIVYSNHFFQVDQRHYLKVVLLPGILPYFLGYGIIFFMAPYFAKVSADRWETLWLLCIAFGLYLAFLIPLVLGWLLTSEERKEFRRLIKRE